jgi:hypothetical protein
MFAIDGVRLPSNASKAKSGTRAEFEREAAKMEAAVSQIIERHRMGGVKGDSSTAASAKAAQRIERMQRQAAQIRKWLQEHPEERKGPKGSVRQSNRTDNESAKLAGDKGVIQGYTGVVAVDEKHQIICAAQAHGVDPEQELRLPMIEALHGQLRPETLVSADSGYCSEENLEELERRAIEALIPDNQWRQRDPRFAEQQRQRDKKDPLHDKSATPDKPQLFGPQDFHPAQDHSHCICPAGKRLYRNGTHHDLKGFRAIKFTAAKRDCLACPLRGQCLRKPHSTQVRQVAIFIGPTPGKPERALERMKHKVDSQVGKELIGRRFATVEPVFGSLRHNKGLDRFTLRGRHKVEGQWQLFCLVHNIEKLAHQGYGK